jgi:hypothetical protein
VAPALQPLQESDLKSWKLLEQFRRRLKPVLEAAPPPASASDPRREVLAEDYFCLLLFGLFNPALKSMSALCHASGRFAKNARSVLPAYGQEFLLGGATRF